jgi:hypothetical protein
VRSFVRNFRLKRHGSCFALTDFVTCELMPFDQPMPFDATVIHLPYGRYLALLYTKAPETASGILAI